MGNGSKLSSSSVEPNSSLVFKWAHKFNSTRFDRGPDERGSRCDDGFSNGKSGGFGQSNSEQTYAKGDQGSFRSGGGGFSGTGFRSSGSDAGSGLRGGAGRVFGGGESGDGRDGGHQYGRDGAQGSGGGRFRSDAGGGFGGKEGGNGGLLNGTDGGRGAFGNPQDRGIDENRKGGFHNVEGDAITGGGGGFHRGSDGRSGFRGGEHSRFGQSEGFEDGRKERSSFGQSRGFWNTEAESADFGRSGGFRDGDGERSGFGQGGGFRDGDGERSGFGQRGGFRDGDGERSGFGQGGGLRDGDGERSGFGQRGGFRDSGGERSGFGQRGGFQDGGGERSGFGQRGGFRDSGGERSGFGQRGGFQDGGGERSGFRQSGGFRDGGGERSNFGRSGGFRDSGERSGFGQRGGFREGGGERSGFAQSGGFRGDGGERSNFGRSGGFGDGDGKRSDFGQRGGFRDGGGERSGFGQRGGFREGGGERSGFGQSGGFRGSGGERSNFGRGGGFGDDGGKRSDFGQRGGFREGGGERSGFGQSGGFRDDGEERPNFGQSGGFRGSSGERSGFGQSGSLRGGGSERSGFGRGGGFQDRDGVGAGGFRRTGSGGDGFRDEGGDFRDGERHRFNGSSNTKGGFANHGTSEGGRRFFKDRESFGGGGFDSEDRFGGTGRFNNASTGGYKGGDNGGFGTAPSRSTYIPEDWPLEEMYEEDARNAKYEVGDLDMEVIVTGVPVPEQQRKLQNWQDAGFEQLLMRNITKCSYAVPRRIQAAIIPLAMNGWDLLGHAETGSGKTLAFMLPIINCIMKDGVPEDTSSAPIALVVAPTRELVSQLYNQTRKIAEGTGVTVAQCYGRTDVSKNVSDIRKGCNILIATVGRLKSFVNNGTVRVHNIRFFVLDEADKMLQVDGFQSDMLDLISIREFPTKEQRQTMLFSATFDKEVQQFAAQLLKSSYAFVSNGKATAANPRVSQTEKLTKLCELLNEEKTESGDVSRTLVFVTRKVDTDTLAMHLSTNGIRASSIHGGRDQDQREKALREFRAGITKVLLATDVCARGIDVPNLEHVINYDLPTEWLVYVHRIGRTGRMHRGKATSFINPMDSRDSSMAPDLLRIVREVQQEAPQFLVDLAEDPGRLAGTASQNSEAAGSGGFTSTGGGFVGGGGGFAAKSSSFARDLNGDDGFASADEDRVIASRSALKGLTSTVSASGGGGDEFSGGKGGGGGGFGSGNIDRGEKDVIGNGMPQPQLKLPILAWAHVRRPIQAGFGTRQMVQSGESNIRKIPVGKDVEAEVPVNLEWA
ncbi:unnamed protein product [Toxocara canis]|uniref:RNA helicase n=1 Tax=Toxocara canis TaxID=6265 RepID=A0A183UJD1_TOXCA|nr:unnamed protein product [Toxocara canis]